MANHAVWFDIPVLDLDRAIRFYAAVLAIEIDKPYPEMKLGVFKHEGAGVSGCLFESPDDKPGATGPLIYLNVNGRLDDAVAQVDTNGGAIVKPKHPIGPFGFRAIVLDSEGNRVALHSE